jgi:hypothetical protein
MDTVFSPLSGAAVVIPALRLADTTDSTGAFSLRAWTKPGCYRLIVAFVGHRTEVRDLNFASTSSIVLGRIGLTPSAVDLQEPQRLLECVPPDTTSPFDWPVAYAKLGIHLSRMDEQPIDSYWVHVEYPCTRLVGALPPGRPSSGPFLQLLIGVSRTVGRVIPQSIRCRVFIRTRDGFGVQEWLEVPTATSKRSALVVDTSLVLAALPLWQ